MGTVVTDKPWRNLDKTDIQALSQKIFLRFTKFSHILNLSLKGFWPLLQVLVHYEIWIKMYVQT